MNYFKSKIISSLCVMAALGALCSCTQNSIVAPTQPKQTGNPVAGKEKSLLCQGCHGEDGNSLSTLVPKLAGQNSAYISKEIHNFQSGKRSHRIMDDLSSTVNDEEISDIAAYFSSLPIMKGDKPSDNQTGMNLFLNGDKARSITACTECHGRNGKGIESNPLLVPVIGGQNRDYLVKQILNFREGGRTNSPDNVMNRITATLTDTEVESLAEYIAGL